jgi:hypothetical protein
VDQNPQAIEVMRRRLGGQADIAAPGPDLLQAGPA